MTDDWRAKPCTDNLVAFAFGCAARIAVRFGLSAEQAARLMRSAWFVVQDMKGESNGVESICGEVRKVPFRESETVG